MIKINLQNQKQILDFHYDNLTKKNGREENLISKLDKAIKASKGNIKSFYNFIKKNVEKDKSGFSILTCQPNDLKLFSDNLIVKYKKQLSRPQIKKLKKIFYYSDYDKWKAYELAKKININTCPYCNRGYTFIVGEDIAKGTRFEYDHFYDKARYPYLALSFFNLIPSCHICNSNLKGSEQFDLNKNIHPYIEGFSNDIVFSIKPKNVTFMAGKTSAYTIKFKRGKHSKWNTNKIKAAIRNIHVFRLIELYNMHKDYVNEIIQKSLVYNDTYIYSLYSKYSGTLFTSIEDVHRFLLGNYTEEFNYKKRVLSKLTTDISKELGII